MTGLNDTDIHKMCNGHSNIGESINRDVYHLHNTLFDAP